MKCRKCDVDMRPGKSLSQTFTGMGDFRDEDDVVTLSPGGPGAAAVDAAEQAPPRFFKGVALETYDGVMKLVDIRGLFPEAKLILSAGNKEVSCVVPSEQVDLLRRALGRRALVTGRAQHDGRSMIPERIDVTSIKLIDKGAPNVVTLKGKLQNLSPDSIRLR